MPDGTVYERLTALEGRVTRLEGMTEVVTAIRTDLAGIAEGVDPTLTQHVAELDDRVEHHGLLLARLFDQPGDDT